MSAYFRWIWFRWIYLGWWLLRSWQSATTCTRTCTVYSSGSGGGGVVLDIYAVCFKLLVDDAVTVSLFTVLLFTVLLFYCYCAMYLILNFVGQ